MPNSLTSFLDPRVLSAKHPAFAETLRDLHIASEFSIRQHKAGKLSDFDFREIQRHLHQQELQEMPIELHEALNEQGLLESMQALGGYEDDRNVDDVTEHRDGLYRQLKQDALDEAWLDQRISAEHYARESHNLEKSDVLDAKIDKGDHDGAAAEAFAARNDVSTHDADLNAYLSKTYGPDYRGREETSEEKPAEKVTSDRRSVEYDDKKSIQENLSDYFGRPEHRQSAVDNNGIVDLEILEEQGEAA